MLTASSSTIFTISRLNQTVRELLEMEMGQVWLTGEISNFSQPASGHWYFTLKDERAQVRCAMFRGSNRRVQMQPQQGQQVLVRATITLYEPRGDYQLIVESMQPAGDGLLQQQFEQLKQKLMTEGLFGQQYKNALPSPAKCVGIITSPTGAALHDILQVLRRRDPGMPVIIYPTQVQGKEAVPLIVRAIELANQRAECDVLIVGRGGGSLEDLWCFNDERVARALFASQIPVVSAVGHEVDITIADFVADLRAPTPSAAAELVSRNHPEMLRQLQSAQQRLQIAMDYYYARQEKRLSQLRHRLLQQHPQLSLARQQSRLLQLNQRLIRAIQGRIDPLANRSELLLQRLMQSQPSRRIHLHQQQLQQQQFRLQQALTKVLGHKQQQFAVICSHLDAVNPLATLARGYSVTRTEQGEVVKSIGQLQPEQVLTTRLTDGWVESKVVTLNPMAH
ncbi:MAG: exodeoxyribonuclease VII large subunit [Enterobacteriaceae bacterium]